MLTSPDAIASVVLRQHGSQVFIKITCSWSDITLLGHGESGETVTIGTSPTAGEFVIDLEQWASDEPRRWTLVAQGPSGPVSFEGAHWQVERLSPWVSGERAAMVTVRPGRVISLEIVTGLVERSALAIARTVVRSVRGGMHLTALVDLPPHLLGAVRLELVERGTGTVVDLPCKVHDHGSSGPFRQVRLTASVTWAALPQTTPNEILDVRFSVDLDGLGSASGKVKAPALLRDRRGRLRTEIVRRGDLAYFYDPRYTFKARFLAVQAPTISWELAQDLKTFSSFLELRRLWYRWRHRPLWLIGEQPFKAQDTGFAFFRHVVENHPEIDARYVIDPNSPDADRVRAVGPMVEFGSREHVAVTMMADRVVASHHPDYLYPLRIPWMRREVRAIRVFLQHGVLGTKWISNLYGNGAPGFETDLFLVSSPRERDLVIRDFKYPPAAVKVTGLSRFDTLLAPGAPERQVLVIPTWRDWILSPESLAESEFLDQWQGLLNDERFREVVGDREVVFIMHPNFREYADQLEAPGVRFVQQGEVAVQDLLRQSEVLITDYSSVGFDFALQHRPVLYFQFDRERFLGPQGSHLDLDADLPGDVVRTRRAVIDALAAVVDRDCSVTPDRAALADSYFPMRDRRSAQRVFDAVLHARRTRVPEWRARLRRGVRVPFRTLRRSSGYFPAMQAFFTMASLLPLRRKLVVFESNLGKGYGDSPKAIYLELRERRPDLTYVWVSNVRNPGVGDGVKVVSRLSWQYFWFLARAKYWVNNQSFPSYLRRRRGQTFIQTWHGTPLKRMGHDAPEAQGRDAGYLSRTTEAAAQWTVLTSPNPHTTKVMASAFQHKARTLEVGYPRNDAFYSQDAAERAQQVRRSLGIPQDHALVLFAPTFRDTALDGTVTARPTEAIDLRAFAEALGDRATLVLRRHVLDRARATIPPELRDTVIDATSIPDVQDLLVAADVLITDYSSLYFDFLNTRRPCIFFAPDLAEYRDVLRGFYLDYGADLPGPVVETVDTLMPVLREAVDRGSIAGYDLDAFAARFCPRDDGRAAARVVDEVFGPKLER